MMKLIQYVPRFLGHAAVIGAVALVIHGMPSYAGIRTASQAPIKAYHQLQAQQSLNSVYAVLPTPVGETPSGSNIADDASQDKWEEAVITFYYCEQVKGYPKGDKGGYCGYFANGDRVTPELSGRVVAATDKYPLGSVLQIMYSDGTSRIVRVVDRGNLEPNGVDIDVFFYTNEEGWKSEISENRDVKVKVKR